MKKFKQGDTVIFNTDTFSTSFWDGTSELNRVKYFGKFGYKSEKLKLFTYLCEDRPQDGHCILVDMETGEVLPMCHTSNFRLATEQKC